MGEFALDAGAPALPAAARSRCRRARGPCCSSSPTPKAKRMRGRVRGAARSGARARPDQRRRGRREPRAVARDVAPARIDPARAGRGRPEHQARHRAAGVARSPTFVADDRCRAARARFPACGWSTSATSATATCTTTCRRRRRRRRPTSCATTKPRSTRIVYDAVAARGGSISAEHGIGALKRDELEQRKSPVALGADARDQDGARSAGAAEPGPRALTHAVSSPRAALLAAARRRTPATSGLRAGRAERTQVIAVRRARRVLPNGATSLRSFSRLGDQRHAAERDALPADAPP